MIETIIFDFGDVFINLDKQATPLGLKKLGLEKWSAQIDSLNFNFEKGLISKIDFLDGLNNLVPNANHKEVLDAWNGVLLDFPMYRLEFLEKIKNLGQLVVKFNTNLTVLPAQQLQEILKKCKRVDFLISVDDIEERYDKLRYPAKWKSFNQNLNEIKKLNYRVFSYNCISSLNIWYMPEFYEWAIKTFEMNIHSQFVTDTDFLDISNLNKNIKEQCLNKIKNYKGKLFDSIRNKLIQENKVTHNIVDDFQKYLSKLDKIRSTDYFGAFEEWWKIIKE